MDSRELYHRFLSRKKAAGISPRTEEAYNYAILPFVKAHSVIPEDMESIEDYIYGNKWSQQKRAFVYRHLRPFLTWYSKTYDKPNPITDVLKPRTKREPIRYLTKEELQRLYDSAFANKKHRAIIMTLIDTGIRVGELLSIKTCNLDHDRLQVNGKSGPRVVPITSSVMRLLHEVADSNSGYVFGHMDRHTVYRLISHYLTQIGFDGKHGPHTLRHTFAVHALRNGMDIITVSRVMGHSTIVMTEQYLRLAQEDIIESHHKFSPINLVSVAEH